MQLEKHNFSQQAADAVRSMIIDGRLVDGERINEVRLAEALGVSRTPLREGLSRLASEGALAIRERRGFFVTPLTLEEFEQLYDIRPLLDPEALRLAGVPDAPRIAQLEKLNNALRAERNPAKVIELDNAWHMELFDACPNRVLIELIQNIVGRTRRYELALFRETKNIVRAGEDHVAIIEALKTNDLSAACAALKKNMQSGKAPIQEWLSHRQENKRKF